MLLSAPALLMMTYGSHSKLFSVGLIQMLRNMDGPTTIGPALAVALLCGFYSVVLMMFVSEPMRRHFSEARA